MSKHLQPCRTVVLTSAAGFALTVVGIGLFGAGPAFAADAESGTAGASATTSVVSTAGAPASTASASPTASASASAPSTTTTASAPTPTASSSPSTPTSAPTGAPSGTSSSAPTGTPSSAPSGGAADATSSTPTSTPSAPASGDDSGTTGPGAGGPSSGSGRRHDAGSGSDTSGGRHGTGRHGSGAHGGSGAGTGGTSTGGDMPSYATSSESAPIVLDAVTAGSAFTEDLAAEHAGADTTYAITVDGSTSLPAGLSFVDGRLSGAFADPGVHLVHVMATNDCGTADEWLSLTVDAASATASDPLMYLGVRVITPEGQYWVDAQGNVELPSYGAPITVHQGDTIQVVVFGYTCDNVGTDLTDDASLASSWASDAISGGGVIDVTFDHASTHTLTASLDGLTDAFAVTVLPAESTAPTSPTDPTTPSAPASPVTPAAPSAPTTTTTSAVAPVAATKPAASVERVAASDPASASTLAYTGSDPSAAVGWAAALLAAGALVTGLRFGRRRRVRKH